MGELPSRTISSSPSSIRRVMPHEPHRVGIGLNSRLKGLPIRLAQIREADDLERSVAIALAQQRLHLKQRIADVKLDR
jgi:hypothetical protein